MGNKRVLLYRRNRIVRAHTVIQLLNKDYEVVGTLRSRDRINSIQEIIGKHTVNIHKLSFAEADLNDGNVWLQLTKDIDSVRHIASPFPREIPIIPLKNPAVHPMETL